MKPNKNWIEDWRYGVDPRLERRVSEDLLEIYKDFWVWADLDAKSKTTQQRYSAALHALGGYIVEKAGNQGRVPDTSQEFLREHIDFGDGPLIHHDNEAWQSELDAVCRKLYKYIQAQC
ncbi:MAG: hypothetical protein U5S82_19685 [Gammaproteobacteria bacterium]|nr:hypothetical protein [Gammaproteobacteria bacterium]